MNPRDWFPLHGVNVFPIKPGTKAPATGSTWKGWTRSVTTPAYGVELGALLVVDTDSPASAAWFAQHGPHTPFTVITGPYHCGSPGRGRHHYFRAPGHLTPAFIERDGLSIEARRLGQYVLGPDSLHPTGCRYEASVWSWRWEDLPVFDFDFGVPLPREGTREAYTPPTAPLTRGKRTHELFRLVRHMKANGASKETTFKTVEIYNQNFCEPPKDVSWLRGWFGRAWGLRDRPLPGAWLLDSNDVTGTELEEPPTPEQLERF